MLNRCILLWQEPVLTNKQYTFSLIILNMNHFREESDCKINHDGVASGGSSFLAHSSDIDDLLEGLDGVLEDWLDGLHDTESSLHIVNLWLHALDGLHLSGDLNEWLSVIESLEDSSGKGLLDVLDGGGLGNSGVTVTSGLGGEGGGEVGLEGDKELILVHVVVLGSGGDGDKGEEFHFFVLFNY